MSKNSNSQYSQLSFWADVAREVYPIFAERVIPYLKSEFLPKFHQNVCQGLSDGSINPCAGHPYHVGDVLPVDDLWFSIHAQIDNASEVYQPRIRVFALLPFVETSMYVLELHIDVEEQSQLDVYPPHFFKQYAARAERFSPDAHALGREYKKFRIFPQSKREKIFETGVKQLHFFIGLMIAQNWFYYYTNNPGTFSFEEQVEDADKKWALVASDSVFFGITKSEEGSPFTLNVFMTNVGYDMLHEDQKAILLPMYADLRKRYEEYISK